MFDEPNALTVRDRARWRRWLKANHRRAREIWLIFFKRHIRKPGIAYPEALEEALSFGWIDGKLKRIDDEKHAIRFSPRRPKSVWSKTNRETAERLMKEGRMTPAGLAAVEEAKKSGYWAAAYRSREKPLLPADLKRALKADKTAWETFRAFAPSYRTGYVGWVNAAKRPETRAKRIEKTVARSARNLKPGIDL